MWSYFTSQTHSILSGSQDRSLPALQRLCAPGIRLDWAAVPAHSRHGWSSIAFLRSGASSLASCLRLAMVKEEVTPTCWSTAASSYSPSSSEPIASFPLLCQRNPATTQSAVRACFTLIIARLPGRYAPDSGFAITPSRPAPSKRVSHSRATARSRVTGVRYTGGLTARSNFSRTARRSDCGDPRRLRPLSASTSKATNEELSLIHISEPTRLLSSSYAV